MTRVRFRRSLLFGALALASGTPALLACFGSDPIIAPGEDTAKDGSTSIDASVATDGGSPNETGPSPRCPETPDRFVDDFEGRTDPLGCWTSLMNGLDASVQIAPREDGGNALRILVSGDGAHGPVVSTHLARMLSVKAPAVVRWRFRVALPNFEDARSGFYPLALRYVYGASVAAESRVIIGSPGVSLLSAFLEGEQPNGMTLDSGQWHQAELLIGSSLSLRVDGKIFSERTLPSPASDLIGVELGVTAGTIKGAYQIAYDDVSIEPAP